MKSTKFIALLFLLLFSSTAFAQIKFQKFNWKKLSKKSKRSGQLVMIDMTASWCGWCKYMDKNIFSLEEVGDYYNKNFIPTKLDGETEEGKVYVEKYEIEGYPTILFLDHEGNLVHRIGGAIQDPDEFIAQGETALQVLEIKGKDFKKLSDKELTEAIITMVDNEMDYKAAYQELKSRPIALSNDEALAISLYLVTKADEDAVKFVKSNEAAFEEAVGEDMMQDTYKDLGIDRSLDYIIERTLNEQSVDFDDIYVEVKRIFKKAGVNDENVESDVCFFLMKFYKEFDMNESYVRAVITLESKVLRLEEMNEETAESYYMLAAIVYQKTSAKKDYELALKWAKIAEKHIQTAELYELMALICGELGDADAATRYDKLKRDHD